MSARTSTARWHDRLSKLLESFDPNRHGGEEVADDAVGLEVLGENHVDDAPFKRSARTEMPRQQRVPVVRVEEDLGVALLSTERTIERLGITKQALSAARKANRLFALERAGQYYYPAFFSDRDFDRPTLEKVALELGDLPSRVKLHWFTRPSLALRGQTPLQAIAAGDLAAVIGAARSQREI